ncbi:PTS sugar transporter subunit IIC [Avibacterium paragallinarum]|uniref:PTS sugar transporter subunit IIC n=1 Tax=Avibacterium paragallinarum TaxID=728 RepID=UPI00021ACC17|nr:PTS sugar transporter subunit IIC [Avibacterium paragallinarum]AZI14844.1 PTS sugar transporter subunit IIC [Avibacterium paragallinarum]QIR12279.1 PTS sugar transporter subunit IIC [Avibacterium paragallinarum]QJE08897.1 PTS sugar transporter subunit IIC [Avibacterium paragallinarum]QJE11094.1 PTS sugar transporter subunit IIC [Avibacterium paragallinarum]QJE13290.1 PTS sugar transporter subunit IIC [Avibacterium paragallinarum]
MHSFTKNMEQSLIQLAGKLAQQRHLGAIRDAYISFMPFIIVGSILLVISSFPSEAYKQFMVQIFGENWDEIIEIPFNVIFSSMALFISFLVAYRLAERYNIDKMSSGILSLSAFLILTPFLRIENVGSVISTEWIGSKGLFIAMLGGIIWTELFAWLLKRNIRIKMPDGVPPAVQQSFAALIPALIILCIALTLRLLFANTEYKTIHQFIYQILAMPIRHFGTSYFGAFMTVFSINILWSVGINSGSMVNGILRPFWLENQAENLVAMQNGLAPPHIVTEQFFDMIFMGGSGSTLALVLAMIIFAKSQHCKKVSILAIGSSIFNINEPVLFGLPVILNPIMLIPFNLVPLVMMTVQYVGMSLDMIATTTGIYIPWTLPAGISGFIVTGHISGAIIQLLNLLIGAMIYLPFLKIIDTQYLQKEYVR